MKSHGTSLGVSFAVVCFVLPRLGCNTRQSSVYCFYDPDYRALSLGKVTALKETEFVREVSTSRRLGSLGVIIADIFTPKRVFDVSSDCFESGISNIFSSASGFCHRLYLFFARKRRSNVLVDYLGDAIPILGLSLWN